MAQGRKYEEKTNFAVWAVWAALISVASLLPTFPIVGTGSTFSVRTILLPLAGILFGPGPGAVICIIGGFIGQMLAPHTAWMGIATFITGVFTGVVAGLVSRGKWKAALAILLLFTVLWLLHPIGRQVPLFPGVFYSLGAVSIVVGGLFARTWLTGESVVRRGLAIWLASFGGFVTAASYANYLGGLVMLSLPPAVWTGLVVISPIERTVFALGAVAVGIPLLHGLPRIGIFVGPEPDSLRYRLPGDGR